MVFLNHSPAPLARWSPLRFFHGLAEFLAQQDRLNRLEGFNVSMEIDVENPYGETAGKYYIYIYTVYIWLIFHHLGELSELVSKNCNIADIR